MLKPHLAKVITGQNLTAAEAQEAMTIIMTGQATDAQIGGYLVALRIKGETAEEITGSAAAMRAVVAKVKIPNAPATLIDTAGTGGDGSHSFNISTAAAFVIAGAGTPVAKHGNRGASSKSGSADVLEALGVNLNLTPEQVGECIHEVGIGFMFAPKFHPAMKHAIGPRRQLAQRTIFNILGPLTNPAGATQQLIGVFAPHLTALMAETLHSLGSAAAYVVHGHGGMDELTTSGPNQVSHLKDGRVTTTTLDPADYDLRPATPADLHGDTPAYNADKMRALLDGRNTTPLKDVVLLNAAAALAAHTGDIAAGLQAATQSLESRAAEAKMIGLIEKSNAF